METTIIINKDEVKAKINNARIRTMGAGFGFYIPKALVENNVLDGGTEYEVIIRAIQNPSQKLNKLKGNAKGGALPLSISLVSMRDETSWAERGFLGDPPYLLQKEI